MAKRRPSYRASPRLQTFAMGLGREYRKSGGSKED